MDMYERIQTAAGHPPIFKAVTARLGEHAESATNDFVGVSPTQHCRWQPSTRTLSLRSEVRTHRYEITEIMRRRVRLGRRSTRTYNKFSQTSPDFEVHLKEIDASQAERLGRSYLSLVPRSRSHARLRRNATMSHVFSVPPMTPRASRDCTGLVSICAVGGTRDSHPTYSAPARYALCSELQRQRLQAQQNIVLRMIAGPGGTSITTCSPET
ncbi:hypothetical protein EVAR_40492_1 [Eumeta japonica]|uniref:Uncharacterized protein n=1 Tax=Eumeta variegata TaxID=151549 RepID=A0A4C1XV06_EUMVA|nr:hypothetical protein EVAR_40492_1 [Eumeta japonica]